MKEQEDSTEQNEGDDDDAKPDDKPDAKPDAKPTGEDTDIGKGARAIAFLKRLFKIGYRPEKSYMRGAKS
jgi:hypothetical protein